MIEHMGYRKEGQQGIWYRCPSCGKEDSLTSEQKLLASIFGELPLCEGCMDKLSKKVLDNKGKVK